MKEFEYWYDYENCSEVKEELITEMTTLKCIRI